MRAYIEGVEFIGSRRNIEQQIEATHLTLEVAGMCFHLTEKEDCLRLNLSWHGNNISRRGTIVMRPNSSNVIELRAEDL
jgi:hypothetical protein